MITDYNSNTHPCTCEYCCYNGAVCNCEFSDNFDTRVSDNDSCQYYTESDSIY